MDRIILSLFRLVADMYELETYCDGVSHGVKKIAPDEVVKSIGRGENCHYRLLSDKEIQPLQAMVRFVGDHFEICPLVYGKTGDRTLPLGTWSPMPFDQLFYVTKKTAIKVKGGSNLETMPSAASANESPSVSTNESSVSNYVPPPLPEILMAPAMDQGSSGSPIVPKTDKPEIVMEELGSLSSKEEEEIEKILRRKAVPEKKEKSKEIEIEQEITGKTLGERYQILKKVGAGAMGEVYEAVDKELKRRVALKIFTGDVEKKAGKRFFQEIRAIGKLRHQNIVSVYDMGEYSGRPFFTMDFLEGQNIQEKIEAGQVPPRDAMTWVRDIAFAIHSAHKLNIVHRDIKPSNIIVTQHGPILTDFGVAKDISKQSQLTTAGEMLGTPAYMSPEQANGELSAISPTTDVYSLGAVLYELLTGKPPFEGTPVEVLQKVCSFDPVPINRLNSDVHFDAITITAKAMCKEQRYRYQTAEQMAEDIQRYLDGEPILGKMPPVYVRMGRIIRQNKAVSALVIAGAMLFVSLIAWKTYADYQTAVQRTETIRQYLSEAEQFTKNATNKTPLDELMKISSLYTQVLVIDPKEKKALKGKREITLMMAENALERGNLNFSEALYHVSAQIKLENEVEPDIRISQGKEKVAAVRQMRMEKQLQEAREMLQELLDQRTEEAIRDAALLLIKYENVFFKLEEEYEYHRDAKVKQLFDLAKKCFELRKDPSAEVKELSELDKMSLGLLPYSHSQSLNQMLVAGLESASPHVRTFCARMLGLTRYEKAVPSLLKRIRYDNISMVVENAIQSILVIEEERYLLEQVRANHISIEKLSFGGKWAVPILLSVLQENPKGNFENVKRSIQKIGKPAIKPMLEYAQKIPGDKKSFLLDLLGMFQDPRVFAFLMKNVHNSPKDVFKSCMVSLGNLYSKEPEAQKILIEALAHEDWEIKKLAIEFLGKIKEASVIPRLIECLKTSPEDVKESIVAALHQIGEAAVPLLKEQIPLIEGEPKLLVFLTLAHLKADGILDPLISELSNSDPKQSKLVIETLSVIGKPALQRLFREFRNDRAMVRMNILQAVHKINDPQSISLYVKAIRDPSKEISDYAIGCLSLVGHEALPPLLEILLHEKSEASSVQKVVEAIGKIGESAIAPLMNHFLSSDVNTKNKIALALLQIGEPVLPHIIPLLKESDPNVRVKVTEMLGHFTEKDEIMPILMGVLGDPVQYVRQVAEHSIVRLREKAFPYLEKKLKDVRDTHEKAAIVEMMGKIQDKRALPILYSLLSDSRIQMKCSLALKEFGPDIIPALIPMLRDAEKEKGVIMALKAMGYKALSYLMDVVRKPKKNREEIEQCKLILSVFGKYQTEQSIKFLFEIVGDNEQILRNAAWDTLATMGSPVLPYLGKLYLDTGGGYHEKVKTVIVNNGYEGVYLLIQRMREGKQHDAHEWIFRIVNELKDSDRYRVSNALISLLRHSRIDVRVNSIRLLGHMKAENAINALTRLKMDKDRNIVNEAEAALGKMKKK